MRYAIVYLIMLLLSGTAWSETARETFNKAVSNYVKGDRTACVELMESAMKEDPSDKEIRSFYLKVLTEYGSDSFFKKMYGDARGYLEKAHELDPANAQISNMLKLCGRADTVILSEGKNQPDMKELLAEFKAQRKKFARNYNYGIDTISSLLKESEKARRSLMNLLDERQHRVEARTNRIIAGSVFIVIFMGFTAVFLTQKFMHSIAAKREESLLEHQKKIFEEMRKNNPVHISLPPLVRNSTHEVITDIDPIIREKARRIELIEEELKTEKDPGVATTLLMPYLDDVSNRVRANAAKALYAHNEKLSLATLKNMLMSYNEWMRSSAVWALGEISTEETIEMLLTMTGEKKESVLTQLRDTLGRIIARKSTSESNVKKAGELLKSVEIQLKNTAGKGGLNGFSR